MPKASPELPELVSDTLTIQRFILAGSGPPESRGHNPQSLRRTLICSVSGRQTETHAAEIKQLPFLAVIGLIKKPCAARFKAPSTDLRDLLIAQLSPQDIVERRLYLPLIRLSSLRSSPDRAAAFSSPACVSWCSACPGYSGRHQRQPQELGGLCPREVAASSASPWQTCMEPAPHARHCAKYYFKRILSSDTLMYLKPYVFLFLPDHCLCLQMVNFIRAEILPPSFRIESPAPKTA